MVMCTNTKTLPSEFHSNDYSNASEWFSDTKGSDDTLPAVEMYSGAGWPQVVRMIEKHGVNLWVYSAGLGIIKGTDLIPAYECSFSSQAEPNNIPKSMYPLWLRGVTWREPEELPDDLVIALPKSYQAALGQLIDLSKYTIIQGGAEEREILGCSFIRLQNTYLEYYLNEGELL